MLQAGKAIQMSNLIQDALNEGFSPKDILTDGILRGMEEIGRRFRKNEIFVPEVLVAARSTVIGIDVLTPYLIEQDALRKKKRKVLVGTVKGDLHDIAKNLLKTLLQGKGFDVIDLGFNVDTEKFHDVAAKEDCFIICISALLTTTMMTMKDIIDDFTKKGDRDRFRIIVGGAPVTAEFAEIIGADYYSDDVVSEANMIEQLYYELYPEEKEEN